ncbi:MAG: SIMPL domain-containing protein [Chloroflexi bacterium]|nr:SIMPL domain-containing protein [Chloroflexota bacterium]MDA1219621.1 SIMPL domain-containing protein [Chloroflexota bacterium]
MIKIVSPRNKILTLLGLGAGLMFAVACATQSPAPTNNAEAAQNQVNPPAGAAGASIIRPVAGAETYLNSNFGSASNLLAQDGSVTGISVSGQGQVSGTPDLATVNLGVEAFRDTVQAAREDAAAAMEDVIKTLKDNGVADQDIRTSYFSINPRYDRDSRNISGFQVSNQLTVKIRNLDNVGNIIDEVTAAGGDLTRFQGINFSIEDVKPLEEQARAAAVADMVAKANQLATLSGVQLGKPFFISETGGFSPLRVAYAETAFFDQAASAPTPIQPGEVDVSISIQAMFAIQ